MDSKPIPGELKFISSYLVRAKEVQEKDAIISYFCRLYAVKLGVEKAPKTADCQAFIIGLMDELEKDKETLAEQEAIQNEMIGYAHVENFALKIFLAADNEDRGGKADVKTAKTFLAASTFLEILKNFGDGELDPEIVQKIKYAKYKTAELMKAIKDGKAPTPGPPGDSPTLPPNKAATPPESEAIERKTPDEKHIPIYQPSAPSAPINFGTLVVDDDTDGLEEDIGYNEKDRQAISAAGKYAKFAVSSLLYDDVSTAITNLQQALEQLRPIKIIKDL